jgi:hypothetical protein
MSCFNEAINLIATDFSPIRPLVLGHRLHRLIRQLA